MRGMKYLLYLSLRRSMDGLDGSMSDVNYCHVPVVYRVTVVLQTRTYLSLI